MWRIPERVRRFWSVGFATGDARFSWYSLKLLNYLCIVHASRITGFASPCKGSRLCIITLERLSLSQFFVKSLSLARNRRPRFAVRAKYTEIMALRGFPNHRKPHHGIIAYLGKAHHTVMLDASPARRKGILRGTSALKPPRHRLQGSSPGHARRSCCQRSSEG
jgi:hypothetical protein